jgi:aldose 1-epimerase
MIGRRDIEGLAALTLGAEAEGGVEAAFVPAAGMIGASLRHRGEEVLGQRQGLAGYLADRTTLGIPFLHPWANRLSRAQFEVAGREVDLSAPDLPMRREEHGLPIHGLLGAAPDWVVERHEAAGDGGVLTARFDFAARADLMAAFPFAHEVRLEVTLEGGVLTLITTVTATGDASVPVAFGYHPYLRLPGVPRADWEVGIPVREHLLLDDDLVPTGARRPVEPVTGRLGDQTFDDGYTAPEDTEPFVLAGGGRRLSVTLLDGYGFAQVFAPAGDDIVAYEPMTAPANALVSGQDLWVVRPGDRYRAAFAVSVADA